MTLTNYVIRNVVQHCTDTKATL